VKLLILACVSLLVGCSDATSTNILTYEQLVAYEPSCDKKDSQLKELRTIQKIKNFAHDPDELTEQNRAYNSRLKATIWWYAYECNK
jgi:hypothetical protein